MPSKFAIYGQIGLPSIHSYTFTMCLQSSKFTIYAILGFFQFSLIKKCNKINDLFILDFAEIDVDFNVVAHA